MKLAVVCRGTPISGRNTLQYLKKSSEKVKKTFKENGWECFEIELKDLMDYENTISGHNNVSEFVFYFIGHGDYNTTHNYFINLTSNKKASFNDIVESTRRTLNKSINPFKFATIFDTCHSGQLINFDFFDKEFYKHVEVLTATNKESKTYESIDFDNGMTIFSHFFCEAVRLKYNNLNDIRNYIKRCTQNLSINIKPLNEKKESFQLTLQPYYSLAQERDQIIIVSDGIKKDFIPNNQNIFFTIELIPVDKDKFKIIIWAEDENQTFTEQKKSDDISYSKSEIINKLDSFLEQQEIPSGNITIIFVLPSSLMNEDIDSWKLSTGKTLGSEYNILLRGRERFRSEDGNHNRIKYKLKDWKANWNSHKNQGHKSLKTVSYFIKEQQEGIPNKKGLQTPLIILKYKPLEKNFINLYKHNISLLLWSNNCTSCKKLKKLIKKHGNKPLENLHTELHDFKSNITGYKENIVLLYDNPYQLPPDEENFIDAIAPE